MPERQQDQGLLTSKLTHAEARPTFQHEVTNKFILDSLHMYPVQPQHA